MRYLLTALAVLVATPALAQNLTPQARLDMQNHKAGVGLRVPYFAGACTAVARQKEGDLCYDTTNDNLYVYDGSAFQPVSPVKSATAALNADSAIRVEKIALATATTGGGVLAWTPGVRVHVLRLVLDITTDASTSPTIDCGVAANATTLNDTLIDGADAGTAAAVFDSNNDTDNGTNGVSKVKVVGSTESVTCSSVGGTALTAMVGSGYIYYVVP